MNYVCQARQSPSTRGRDAHRCGRHASLLAKRNRAAHPSFPECWRVSLRGRCPARGHANLRRDDIQNLREESLGSIEERLAGGLTEIDKLIETRREKRPGFFAKVQDLGGLGIEVREQLRCIETIDHLPGVLPENLVHDVIAIEIQNCRGEATHRLGAAKRVGAQDR